MRYECSTPFGITDYFGDETCDRGRHGNDVLNAFRHHGLFRPSTDRSMQAHHPVVLNAFRHHGLFRRRPTSTRRSRSTSAQRLSASRIISVHAALAQQAGDLGCSTPFGITDYFGLLTRRPCARPQRCAQRLSASRIISGGGGGGGEGGGRSVLNAFRHHGLFRSYAWCVEHGDRYRCSTPFGITDYFGLRQPVFCRLNRGCSTPFGITDYFGR